MADTPMTVQTRPFAIEPITGTMAMDGIFDNAIHKQRIACHYTNTSGTDLTNVTLYLESIGDPGIAVTGHTFAFPLIPTGASVLVSWLADFQSATPGKPLVSFVAKADGYQPLRTLQQIFVSETRYDSATDKWTCTVPEGRLEVSNLGFLLPPNGGWWPAPKPPDDRRPYRLAIPTRARMTWIPVSPYPGQHGELPFQDPWWKVLVALIVWLIGVIVIVVNHNGQGDATVGAGAQGQFDETDPAADCCDPGASGSASGELGAKIAGWSLGVAAVTSALQDHADPWWRGQDATKPLVGELTVAETVDAQWQILQDLVAGKPGRFDVRWDYKRQTTATSYGYGIAEVTSSEHIADPVDIRAPAIVHTGEDLWVTAQLSKADQSLFIGPQLYALALFQAPQGLIFLAPMGDDGLGFDERANDALYTGGIDFERAQRALKAAGQTIYGRWHVYVFAQDVNRAPAGLAPHIAAQTIGGITIVTPMQVTLGTNGPCPLSAQATIDVVQ